MPQIYRMKCSSDFEWYLAHDLYVHFIFEMPSISVAILLRFRYRIKDTENRIVGIAIVVCRLFTLSATQFYGVEVMSSSAGRDRLRPPGSLARATLDATKLAAATPADPPSPEKQSVLTMAPLAIPLFPPHNLWLSSTSSICSALASSASAVALTWCAAMGLQRWA